MGHQIERQGAHWSVGGDGCGGAHHVLPDHVDPEILEEVRVLTAPGGAHVVTAEVRVVDRRAKRRHALAVRRERRIAIGIDPAIGAVRDRGGEQPAPRLAPGPDIVEQARDIQELLPLPERRHLPSLIKRIVGDERSHVGRALEAAGVQVGHHLGGSWKLGLAVGENAIIVLEVDVDVQTIDRDAGVAIGAGDALQASTVVVAVAALVEPKGVLGRHGTAPGQTCELA